MKLNRRDSTLKLLRQYITLFDSFDEMYLFGSILNNNITPNDIDILLIYSKKTRTIVNEINTICLILERVSGLPIDLTVLSMKEEAEINFLERIKGLYVKVK